METLNVGPLQNGQLIITSFQLYPLNSSVILEVGLSMKTSIIHSRIIVHKALCNIS